MHEQAIIYRTGQRVSLGLLEWTRQGETTKMLGSRVSLEQYTVCCFIFLRTGENIGLVADFLLLRNFANTRYFSKIFLGICYSENRLYCHCQVMNGMWFKQATNRQNVSRTLVFCQDWKKRQWTTRPEKSCTENPWVYSHIHTVRVAMGHLRIKVNFHSYLAGLNIENLRWLKYWVNWYQPA